MSTRTARTICLSFALVVVVAAPGHAQRRVRYVGWGEHGPWPGSVPPPPTGLEYTTLKTGEVHNAALRSDGQIYAWGANVFGCCDVPPLPAGVTYTDVDVGSEFTVAVRSDGQVACWGRLTQGTVPPLPPGTTYSKVVAGNGNALALRSDGIAVGWALNCTGGLCGEFGPPTGVSFVQLAAGNGIAALGSNGHVYVFAPATGLTPVPPLPPGTTYTKVSFSWGGHIAALRSDGQLLAWGDNTYFQCNIPTLPPIGRDLRSRRSVDGVERCGGYNRR